MSHWYYAYDAVCAHDITPRRAHRIFGMKGSHPPVGSTIVLCCVACVKK